ncbi:SMI1/KNR4 family protein [Bacillus sp. es.036]|uniref:SMI1/KNR4 family protein n=1 Tax=Bacillus sp. es.036 TaxID=1761764 RepID=UPI000BFA5F68|nr:SMI1/KNR4 family protein [Bacillus sp. es.036]PFG12305.1 SMI1/KNR4 family protein SUKH-1 [Bacillus sp. es.036]
MTKVLSENPKITLDDIKKFENENNLKLPKEYIEFLLEHNGGFPQESGFKISEVEGESLVNKFYGIGNMKSNLGKVLEVLEGEIPAGFISIANDPAGNEILIGISGDYLEKVYFWMHDVEPEEEMDNMFILADSFSEFLDNLYDSD